MQRRAQLEPITSWYFVCVTLKTERRLLQTNCCFTLCFQLFTVSGFAQLKESVLIGCCVEIIFITCVQDVKPSRFNRLIHKNSNFMSQNMWAACLQLAQLLASCCCMTLVFLMYLVMSEMLCCINSTLFSRKSRWFCETSLVVRTDQQMTLTLSLVATFCV